VPYSNSIRSSRPLVDILGEDSALPVDCRGEPLHTSCAMTEKVGLGAHSYKKCGWLKCEGPPQAITETPRVPVSGVDKP
jgi:hypothetical protein